MRSRLLALAAGLLVVVGFPLVRLVGRTSDPAPGDLDLSDAWSWAPVIAAGLATSAAVFFWSLHRDSARRERAPYETFEYHDRMLQSVLVVRMALELDEPARAERVLDGVIASAGEVVTAFVDQRGEKLASALLSGD
jgi:hypothetical protein